MRYVSITLLYIAFLAFFAAGCAPRSAGTDVSAKDAGRPERLMLLSERALSGFLERDKDGALAFLMENCAGFVIFPRVLRAGFLVSAEGGEGVLYARDASGEWHGPSFHTVGGIGFGPQAGLRSTALLMVYMNEETLRAAVKGGPFLEVGVSINLLNSGENHVSPVAGGAVDAFAISDSMGVFGGAAFDGAAMEQARGLMLSWYGISGLDAEDVAFGPTVPGPSDSAMRVLISGAGKRAKKKAALANRLVLSFGVSEGT